MKRNGFSIIGTILIIVVLTIIGCGSTPKTPRTLIADPSIPEERTAMLYLTSYKELGTFWVTSFNGNNVTWMSGRNEPLNVQIPENNRNIIRFHFKHYSGREYQNVQTVFRALAGRNYRLHWIPVDVNLLDGSATARFPVYETTQTIDPNPDEQILFINYDRTSANLVFVLNKGTNDERQIMLGMPINEIRIIVPRGEHTVDVEFGVALASSIEPNGEQPRHFSVSTEHVRYTVTAQHPRNVRVGSVLYNLTKN